MAIQHPERELHMKVAVKIRQSKPLWQGNHVTTLMYVLNVIYKMNIYAEHLC